MGKSWKDENDAVWSLFEGKERKEKREPKNGY